MAEWQYLDLDLAVDRVDQAAPTPAGAAAAALPDGTSLYAVRVISSPAGEAQGPFTFPLSDAELELFRSTVGPPRVTSRRLLPAAAPTRSAKTYGEKLNDALFTGPIADCFSRSLAAAEEAGKGLRLRLRFSGAPALDPVPWEYLWASSLGRFVALSAQTPVVRYFDTRVSTRTLRVDPPMRVLVMVSSPTDAPALEVEKEVRLLQANTADLVKAGLLELVFERTATLQKLQHHLSYGTFHIFHFIGHGAFDASAGEGVLLFEADDRTSHRVKGSYVGTLLHDARAMQLAVINACEGARSSGQDSWSGVGQSLVRQGLPAVVAMQAEISDRAALAFSHEFYYALCQGFPVDAAMAEARKAIGGVDDGSEWGTPVLLQSATEQPFELITTNAVQVSPDVRFDSLVAEAQQAIASGNRELAEMLLSTLMSSDAGDDRTGFVAAGLATMGDGPLPDAATTAPEPTASVPTPDPLPVVMPPSGGSGPGSPNGAPGRADEPGHGGVPRVPGDRAEPGNDRHGVGLGKGALAGLLVLLLVGIGFWFWPKSDDGERDGGHETVTTAPTTTTTHEPTHSTSTTPTTSRTAATIAPRTPTVVDVSFTEADKVIDGQIDDWPRAVDVTSGSQIAPSPGGRTDISAQWWLAWNANALYVYAAVTDPTITPVSGPTSQAYRGDAISFEFGGDYPGPLARDTRLRRTDLHLILGIADLNGRVLAQRNLSNGSVMAAGSELTDVKATWWQLKGGYAIEAAIPWSDLLTTPGTDKLAAMNFNVSDAVPDGSKAGTLRVMVSSNASRVKQTLPGLWDVARFVATPR